MAILLQKSPPSKSDEYDKFPLSSQLGFIHAIPEDEFSTALATIIDIGFLGLFPKKIFQTLWKYERELERFNTTASGDYSKLIDNLITAFVYRPITVQ